MSSLPIARKGCSNQYFLTAPNIWGPLADATGRRPAYIVCLFLLSASCVGLALVPTNTFWLLMVLRVAQAAGSASMIALGAGVVSDIAVPAERGSFLGFSLVGTMVHPFHLPYFSYAKFQ